ncbi:MAG: twin-arginine translocase subunit TatC [Candidatus Thalassarchaeaceae archaeon]|nr:twin-arginine translocase subunit TatC [Candidatus Thalassarchaeaceae archaeon]
MVVLVSKDNKKSVSKHLHDLIYLLRINLTLFIIFSFFWAFFIEDIISHWANSISIENINSKLTIYGPYEWIEIQWSMIFVLSLISIMPFLSYSIFKFFKNGLLPSEKSWLSILLFINLVMVPVLLLSIWFIIIPNFINELSAQVSIYGIENRYDVNTIFKFTIGITWIFMIFSFSTISISLARLLGLFENNSNFLNEKIILLSASLIIVSLPDEFEGLKIIITIFIIYMANLFSHTIPNYPIGRRSYSVKERISSKGNSEKYSIIDCKCEGACPKFPTNFQPSGIAMPNCSAICLNGEEQDKLIEMVIGHNISQIIITGCDGLPLPANFKNILETNNCKVLGLEWMDSEFSDDEIWKLNTLYDSIS